MLFNTKPQTFNFFPRKSGFRLETTKRIKINMQNSPGKSVFSEIAIQVLLNGLASQESSEQMVSASILSNLAGTYAWTGEPYTAAWLLKKTGLTSPYCQNMIRNFNWLDQSLQVSCQEGSYVIKFKLNIY